jgi:hypothetical protein
MKLKQLIALGFDESYHIPFKKELKVMCSQCEPMVVNGVPCHEQGCPNIIKEWEEN